LLSVALDATGGQLTNDRLVVSVPSNTLSGAAELNVLLLEPSSVPPPPAGFVEGDDAFVITLTDNGTRTQLSQLTSPISLEYRLSAAEINQAGGDVDRLKVAYWTGDTWAALACSPSATAVECTSPHLSLFALLVAPPASDILDSSLPNGWFYKQANGFNGGGDAGFSVVDDSDASMWTEFQRLGGVDRLGYPISQRFQFGGYVTQAFQRVALEWQPDSGHADTVTIMDALSARGTDGWLESARQVPPAVARADVQPDGDAVLLDAYPSLRGLYDADPDPMTDYGLPVAVKQYGSLVSVRLQRGVLQLWTLDEPWAEAGTVIAGNAGDLAKEAGLWPMNALVPSPASPDVADTDT
jgi:hypothetical protein